jgi:7,8-dihydropterin-6-yl-methyl-4-(beta-D-ribofuranosyl)aminobenzene 5'-phosphate synthase
MHTNLIQKTFLVWLSATLLTLNVQAGEHLSAPAPEITILSTMVANLTGEGEWGFSALIQTEQEAILFDTGFKPDTVLKNAETLGLNLGKVQKVILTHFHSDHTGGLFTLRRALMQSHPNALTEVYVGKGFFRQRYDADQKPVYSLAMHPDEETFTTPESFRATGEALGIRFFEVGESVEISPGMFLTGPIKRVHDERNYSPGMSLHSEGRFVPDWIPESQVLGINLDPGWLLISGCGHAGIVNAATALRTIIEQPVHTGVGGFHLFRASAETVAWTAKHLERFGLKKFVGAHCTGIGATYQIGDALGLPHSALSAGAVGTRIDRNLNIIRTSIE